MNATEGRWPWLTPSQFEWEQGVTPFSHIAWPVGGGLFYLAMVGALQLFMSGRKPFDVSLATRYHNLFLVVLSIVLSAGIWFEVVNYFLTWMFKTQELMVQEAAMHPARYGRLVSRAAEEMVAIEYSVPWYNLNCHKWCVMQPEVKAKLASGETNLQETMRWCNQAQNPVSGSLYYWIYFAYLWKFYDFVDTALLVLNKKPLIFLHVFHHATVPLCAWMGFEGRLLMPLWMGMGINSVVHGIMYYYYYLRTCGKKVWWRKLVTQIQTSQFVLGAFMTAYGAFHFFKEPKVVWDSTLGLPYISYERGCDAHAWAIYTCGFFNLAFLFLFVQWYVSTYKAAAPSIVSKGKKTPAAYAAMTDSTLSGHEKTC